MAWIYLVLAGLFEIAFAIALKLSDGFTRPWPVILFTLFAGASFIFLARAIVVIPIGTAYAVWTGIGAAGAAIVGLLAFGEPATALRLLFIATLIGSVIGLKLTTPV